MITVSFDNSYFPLWLHSGQKSIRFPVTEAAFLLHGIGRYLWRLLAGNGLYSSAGKWRFR